MNNIENIEDREPIVYPSKTSGQLITKTAIYWAKSPWREYFVPQEIEFKTKENLLVYSSIEVNNGEVNNPLTDETLIIENELCLKKLQLGAFGLQKNGRYVFNNLEELVNYEKNIN